MDINSPEDGSLDASEQDSDGSKPREILQLPPNRQIETIPDSSRSSFFKETTQSAKWDALKSSYHSKYLELFRESWQNTNGRSELDGNFDTTQHGALIWQGEEKSKLFRALERHGRRNLAALSDEISTKSEVEVKSYLDLLQQAELDRQLYYRQTENALVTEIPAAVEVGKKLEAVLDEAAASLEAYQEQYDHAVAARGYGSDYIINIQVANSVDSKTDSVEQQLEEADLEDVVQTEDPCRLFKLCNFVNISTTLFMIGTPERPKKDPDSWMALAFGGESPAMTQDAVSDFHAIVSSLTQRLVQTTIFLTESRLRASSTRHWQPLREVRTEDVESALQILNCDHSLWEFWINWPRRGGVKIWSGSHRKGATMEQEMDFDTAEQILSKPAYRGRHSRSRSVSTGSLPSRSDSEQNNDTADPSEHHQAANQSEGEADEADSNYDPSVTSSDDSSKVSDRDSPSEDDLMEANASQLLQSDKVTKSLPKRKRILEKELTQYMNESDARQSLEEKDRIENILGIQTEARINEEMQRPRKKPKVLRKTVEEVEGWQVPSLAAWEVYEFPTYETDTLIQEKEQKYPSRSMSEPST